MDNITTLIIAVVGSGGLSALLTAILSARKFKAEASSVEQQTEANHKLMEEEMSERLHKHFVELAERYKAESEEQRAQTKELEKQVSILNRRLNQLMSWIMTDDASYKSKLEDEIKRTNPDFIFPHMNPIPGWKDESVIIIPQ